MDQLVLASDFDETLATGGRVLPRTLAAIERLKESGRKFILVTGRRLEDLEAVFPELEICDRIVGENGAVVYDPGARDVRPIAEPPPPAFAERLAASGVEPLEIGHVIVATREPHQEAMLAAIQELGLELHIIFNKGGVMALPTGVNKGVGLQAVLDEFGIEKELVAAIGDAENDHSLFEVAGYPVAVANAIDSLKQKAALVTRERAGAGVEELIGRLLSSREAPTAFGRPAAAGDPTLPKVVAREAHDATG
ncbi:MAG: HAD family hydrolase [Hyphomicrobiales bacterium]